MKYYLGSKALITRAGVKSYRGLQGLIERDGFPVFLRLHRQDSNHRCHRVLVSNEQLILAWELSQVEEFRNLTSAMLESYRQRKRQIRHEQRGLDVSPT